MKVTLLGSPPISGSVLERHFDVSAGTNAWVQFDNDEQGTWVGVFGSSGLTRFNAVAPFADDGGRTVLVIAGGQGYVVNAQSGELLRRTPWDYAQAAFVVPGRDFILVADDTRIWAADRSRDRYAWRRDRAWYDTDDLSPPRRVSLDGIIFDEMTGQELSGKVWEMDGWYGFRLGLDDLEFTRGGLVSPHREAFAPF